MKTLSTPQTRQTESRPRLRLAVQKKGRLNEPSLGFLASLGIECAPGGTSLVQQCSNYDLDVLFLRDDDIPDFVEKGVADFGIVGYNVLLEMGKNVVTLRRMDFGVCRLVIATPTDSCVRTSKDLQGARIATTYPRLLENYLARKGVSATIVPLSGSVEIAPELDLADAICDIVQTGSTLKAHNLREIETVLDSRAVLITSPDDEARKQAFLALCNASERTDLDNV
jgi:ATP phosphoribosyltransferase